MWSRVTAGSPVTRVSTRVCAGASARVPRHRGGNPKNDRSPTMNTRHSRRSLLAGLCAASVALTLATADSSGAAARTGDAPTVATQGGVVQGTNTGRDFEFRGIPYAA